MVPVPSKNFQSVSRHPRKDLKMPGQMYSVNLDPKNKMCKMCNV